LFRPEPPDARSCSSISGQRARSPKLDRQWDAIHAKTAGMFCADGAAYLERFESVISALTAEQSRLLDALAAQPIATNPDAVAVARLAIQLTDIGSAGLFMSSACK
jgi:hypothetical protein